MAWEWLSDCVGESGTAIDSLILEFYNTDSQADVESFLGFSFPKEAMKGWMFTYFSSPGWCGESRIALGEHLERAPQGSWRLLWYVWHSLAEFLPMNSPCGFREGLKSNWGVWECGDECG